MIFTFYFLIATNDWVYEKVCLDKFSNLPQMLVANFLIHLVSTRLLLTKNKKT